MSPFKSHSSLEEAVRSKLIDPDDIEKRVAEVREKNFRIATLNGSFDILHSGHLYMIFEAAKQADVLIVALNTDRSIKEYKNPLRPIIPLEDRVKMMASLAMVDHVTWFDETDPRALLARIRPDVHVNGAEYGENCLEADIVRAHGGMIHIVPVVPELSTSQIIKKILTTCG